MTIGSASLSSGAFFNPALFAIQKTNNELATSTLKLSTGSRISRAGDDVAAFSIATRLQTQTLGLKQATKNAIQGDSLLQVAQGGLQQITDILDRLSTISSQANSSSLSSADRSYLQAEFSQYIAEIDRIATNTSFNNINLLDGTLSGENKPETTTTAATKASATLAFTANPTAGQTVILNNVTFTADTDFTVTGTTAGTIDNLVTTLNASTNVAISQASYSRVGDSLVITAKSGGKQGNNYTIDKANSTSTFTVTGGSTQVANLNTLTGGLDDGLNVGSVVATGTIGDPLVNTQSQTSGSVTFTLSGAASNGELLRIDNGNGGYVDFTFATSASASTDIQIGADTEETLQNTIETITQYSGTSNFVTRQLDFKIDGNSLIISNKNAGNAFDFTGAVPDIAETVTNGSLSAATITGGTNTGINVKGVNNKDFVGSISGFTASYVGPDSLTASITVGSSTYTAAITDTTPSSNTTVRFSSTSGGYFDIQLAAGQGITVTNSTTADAFASRLNAAIEGLTFYQARNVSNFEAVGAFVSGSAKLQLGDFSDVRIDSINVTAPASDGQDATIDVSINGETFRASSGIRGALGAYESLKFTSLSDSNKVLTITNGSSTQDFSDATAAASFEEDLRAAFGLNDAGSGGVTFQVGTNNTDTVEVVVNTATTDKLFNGVEIDVTTQDNAADAQDVIDTAQESVLTSLSKIGALQARFQSVQELNNKIIEGVESARSNLADTDIAEESTTYALAALRLNAGVSILAQTKQLQSGLLDVLRAGLN